MLKLHQFADIITLQIAEDDKCNFNKENWNSFSLQCLENEVKKYLCKEGVLLFEGITFKFQYLTQEIKFLVHNISGVERFEQVFRCTNATDLTVYIKEESNDNILLNDNYFDNKIGGHKKQIAKLNSIINEVFNTDKNKLKKVDGVLLYGPSGTGKSLVGEILKNYFGDKCLNPSVDEIKSKFKGETEHQLQNLFKTAASR